jgi:hypothetical protein
MISHTNLNAAPLGLSGVNTPVSSNDSLIQSFFDGVIQSVRSRPLRVLPQQAGSASVPLEQQMQREGII